MQTRELGQKVFVCSDGIELGDLFTYEEDFEIFSEMLALLEKGVPLEMAGNIVAAKGKR